MTKQPYINDDFANLLPGLSSEEREGLRSDIQENGVRNPVHLCEDGMVMDGHNRFELAEETGKDCPSCVIPGSGAWSVEEKQAYAIRENLNRRHFSELQRRALERDTLIPLARRLHWGVNGNEWATAKERVRSEPEVARLLGVSKSTIDRWVKQPDIPLSQTGQGNTSPPPVPVPAPKTTQKIPKEAWEEIYDRWKDGETQKEIAEDYKVEQPAIAKTCKKIEKQRETEARIETTSQLVHDGVVTSLDDLIVAEKKFQCIYADPPWKYGNQGTRAATDNHYPTMTVDEIAAERVSEITADDCHLHLWTTNAFLFDAQKVMESWGFTYKSVLIWVKPQMGIGNYWRVSHEFLLLGVKGKLKFQNRAQKSWFEENRTKHSAKPEEARKRVMLVSPGPYLEMYGRKVTDGWSVYGNEVQETA